LVQILHLLHGLLLPADWSIQSEQLFLRGWTGMFLSKWDRHAAHLLVVEEFIHVMEPFVCSQHVRVIQVSFLVNLLNLLLSHQTSVVFVRQFGIHLIALSV